METVYVTCIENSNICHDQTNQSTRVFSKYWHFLKLSGKYLKDNFFKIIYIAAIILAIKLLYHYKFVRFVYGQYIVTEASLLSKKGSYFWLSYCNCKKKKKEYNINIEIFRIVNICYVQKSITEKLRRGNMKGPQNISLNE